MHFGLLAIHMIFDQLYYAARILMLSAAGLVYRPMTDDL